MKNRLKWFKLNGLVLGVLMLSIMLSACSTAINTAIPAAATSVPTATVPAAAPTSTTAANVPTAFGQNPTVTVGTTPATSTTPSVAVIDPNLKGDLIIWEAMPPSQQQFAREQANTFGKAYPGVKVTILHFNTDELVYALEDAVKSGKLPDLILASSDFVTDFNTLKAIQPADKGLDKTFLDKFATNALASSTVNNVQWGVPYTYSGATVMMYNKKLVPTPPTTWKELEKVVTPLYDPKTRNVGLAIEVNEPYFLTSVLGAFGGAPLNSTNQPSLDTPEMINALNFIGDLSKNKVVRAESRAKDNQIDYAFRDGRLGIFITSDADIAKYSSTINATGDAKLELGVAPLPKVDANSKDLVPFNNSKTFFLGAKVSGDRLNVVKTYLNWVATPEQQALILSKTSTLAATKAFLSSETVKGSAVWSGLLTQLELSKPQPVALEMRAVYDAMRPNLQDVVAGTVKPADAAKKMQQSALANVAKLTSP